jgi:DNA ligase (NAD+)
MEQKELTELLAKASEAYYNSGNAIMSDLEFDRKVEELRQMEKESGVVLPGSPTQKVGTPEKVDGLKKVTHEYPALSLDKVKYKDRKDLVKWLGNKEATVSWKMDGLTVVLTYDGGKLTQAVTRGDGIEGSDVTHNAVYFEGVPKQIAYPGHLVVRGEAVMEYKEFERVNAEAGGIYENPRNLAAATVQMLDANESRKRKISFYAFELVAPEPKAEILSVTLQGAVKPYTSSNNISMFKERMNLLGTLRFQTVPIEMFVTAENILEVIDRWEEQLHEGLPFPTDGLVITYDDVLYGWGLGSTGHHPRWAMALKWSDECAETTITDVEWSVGKTGLITPVAVFNPVRLGAGSTITRASLHNVSIMRSMPAVGSSFEKEPVRIGCKAWIYLANMIIPQVEKIQNTFDGGMTCPTEYVPIPDRCPICGAPTEIRSRNGFRALYCTGNNCRAQVVASLMNTFSKDGLFIKGLGESQIEDLMKNGIVDATPRSFYDIAHRWKEFEANPHRSESEPGYLAIKNLLAKDGWGIRKWNNLMSAIEASRNTTLQKFLYSLNIPLLGNDLSKKLSKYWNGDIRNFVKFIECNHANDSWAEAQAELTAIEGVGDEKAGNVITWMEEVSAYREKYEEFMDLISELKFPETTVDEPSDTSLAELTFVITGAVHSYRNREEFKASVEARGGKVAGSVSKNTTALVNNDVTSTSGKNQKAKELGIEIISEDEFINRYGK